MSVLLISVQRDLDVLGLKYLHQYLLERDVESSLVFMPGMARRRDALVAAL